MVSGCVQEVREQSHKGECVMMTAIEARYHRAIARIGGGAGLLALPEPVKKQLRETKDLLSKTILLEKIADEIVRRMRNDKR